MKLYEVVFWGSQGNPNAEDTIYLVRAPDHHTAAEFTSLNASACHHNGVRSPVADLIYELGVDGQVVGEPETQFLRGPYYAFAYNHGWRAWQREEYLWREVPAA